MDVDIQSGRNDIEWARPEPARGQKISAAGRENPQGSLQ